MNKPLLIATHNEGKFKEFKDLLAPIECVSARDFQLKSPDETGLSFVENALLKARFAAMKTNLPAIADDSGLVVPALSGRPGIHSARYAGIGATDAENIEKLLKDMEGLPADERGAYFYCALALVSHPNDPTPVFAVARMDGIIATQPDGQNGFGYDPCFYIPSEGKTLAALPKEFKMAHSHRAKALKKLKQALMEEQWSI